MRVWVGSRVPNSTVVKRTVIDVEGDVGRDGVCGTVVTNRSSKGSVKKYLKDSVPILFLEGYRF